MATTFNLSSFRNALVGGGARPNQFEVAIIANNTLGIPFTVNENYLVNIAELPGSTVNPAIVFYRGREVKLVGDRVYPPITMTFLNDSNFSLRGKLERWLHKVDNVENKQGIITPASYFGTVLIKQLNRNGTVLRIYKLNECFPIDVSPIGLDYSANDQLSTCTVTWHYQFYTVGTTAEDNELTSVLNSSREA